MNIESDPNRFADARKQMINWQLRARNINDHRVLQAMAELPREAFIPEPWKYAAYEDQAVPIGYNQTISQPYIVALMSETLQANEQSKVLEIGTGSGYQTAVLARIANEVFTIERIAELSRQAQEILQSLGITNVQFKIDDGTSGWQEFAPFDRIMVTAAAPDIPTALADQLADNGVMIIPVGPNQHQTLLRVRRQAGRFLQEPLIACRFVKLIGRHAWPNEIDNDSEWENDENK